MEYTLLVSILQSLEIVCCLGEQLACGDFTSRVTSVRNYDELQLWKHLLEVMRRPRGTYDVVATLDNHRRDVPDLVNRLLLEELPFAHEAAIDEVVCFDPCKGKCPIILLSVRDILLADPEF